jgi:hypothetical protein
MIQCARTGPKHPYLKWAAKHSDEKPLTVWLILLILILSIGSIGSGGPMVATLPETYQPYFPQFPSLQRAVTITQVLLSISIALGAYTAWVLVSKETGKPILRTELFSCDCRTADCRWV